MREAGSCWNQTRLTGLRKGRVWGLFRERQLFCPNDLRQNLFHHAAVYVGESEVSSLEAVGEPFVIETQQMQESGVEVCMCHLLRAMWCLKLGKALT